MIVLVDFGSQTAHLIGRRIRDFGVEVEIVEPEVALDRINEIKPQGIVLSGGPASVYGEGAPQMDPKALDLGIPTLSICYGFQFVARALGGEVIGGKKEYGPAELRIKDLDSEFVKDTPDMFTVWMSHGDEIIKLPEGFEVLGETTDVPFALSVDKKRKIIGMLFHPEVHHTEHGDILLKNFVEYCNITPVKKEIDIEKVVTEIKEKVGDRYVIGAVSGGVDSTVAGALAAKAIGDHFIPIYVNNGLMRQGNREHVKKIFEHFGVRADIVDCEDEMLKRLKGATDPEVKRKIIGGFYIEIFEREMQKLILEGKDVGFLLQGTIYSDVIESKGTKHAEKIKSHHNVGGLPEDMKLELIEPVRPYYKDEVRKIGEILGLPEEFVWKQVFPGPGYAVRIRGEVTKERLEQVKKADSIILEELEKENLLKNIFMSFPIMTGADSVAVKGDGRFFGEVIALRIVESKDVMTAHWSRLPYDVLQKISSRIVNEVPGVSRVVYDISTKPPATMEWE